jgi:D-3-phosphoglycerate dehydrogenase
VTPEAFPTSFPKEKVQVLLLEDVHPSANELVSAESFQLDVMSGALNEDDIVARIAGVHVLGIRSKTRITERVLSHARRLLTVGCFCIGTNQVDLRAANRRGIPVFNAPFANTRSVAEMVLAEIVLLARRLGDRSREMHAGLWRKVAAGSHEVRGKTLGIIGYGHIGRQVGVMAEALGMRVVFYDIVAKLPMGNNHPTKSLDELLALSDFVTLHVPETPQTERMIADRELTVLKKGGHLINASRGSIVDVPALAAAIGSGHVGGAAIDVFPEEPENNGEGFRSPLQGLPNVLLSPHVGGSTAEAQEAIGREVATALIKFVNTGVTTGAVNFPEVDIPPMPGKHRVLNAHRNVPGVLRDITHIVSDLGANIAAQVLATDADTGYLVMDLDQNVSHAVKNAVAGLDTSIKTRILT